MQRLLKIASFTVLVFLGGVLTFAGVHWWSVTDHTVLTVLDQVSQTDSNGDGSFGHCIVGAPWFDWGFMIQRFAAATVLTLGISILWWAIKLMRMNKQHDYAT
jgi:hypothetical protein